MGLFFFQIARLNYSFLILFVCIISCNGQDNKTAPNEGTAQAKVMNSDSLKEANQNKQKKYQVPYIYPAPEPSLKISEFVRRIFQDKSVIYGLAPMEME